MIIPVVEMSSLHDGGPVPEGEYTLRVDKAEFVAKPATPGASAYYKLTLRITGPDGISPNDMNACVFMSYPIVGRGSYYLRDLLIATGHPEDFRLESPEQLLNLEFRAQIEIKTGTAGRQDKNSIKAHYKLF